MHYWDVFDKNSENVYFTEYLLMTVPEPRIILILFLNTGKFEPVYPFKLSYKIRCVDLKLDMLVNTIFNSKAEVHQWLSCSATHKFIICCYKERGMFRISNIYNEFFLSKAIWTASLGFLVLASSLIIFEKKFHRRCFTGF